MLDDTEYAEYLFSYTNGFGIKQHIITPLIRIHPPPSDEEVGRDEETKCHEDINLSIPISNKQPSMKHERDCYLMPYSYNDIRSTHILLPHSRSKSLTYLTASCPTPCEQCKRYP